MEEGKKGMREKKREGERKTNIERKPGKVLSAFPFPGHSFK